jgi:hypothetical protein
MILDVFSMIIYFCISILYNFREHEFAHYFCVMATLKERTKQTENKKERKRGTYIKENVITGWHY